MFQPILNPSLTACFYTQNIYLPSSISLLNLGFVSWQTQRVSHQGHHFAKIIPALLVSQGGSGYIPLDVDPKDLIVTAHIVIRGQYRLLSVCIYGELAPAGLANGKAAGEGVGGRTWPPVAIPLPKSKVFKEEGLELPEEGRRRYRLKLLASSLLLRLFLLMLFSITLKVGGSFLCESKIEKGNNDIIKSCLTHTYVDACMYPNFQD